jgi:AraC-like DNA-binding protein
MNLAQLDAAIRISGIAMILVLAWLLVRQWHKVGVPALLFPPMAICLSGFLIGNTPDPSVRLTGALGAIAHFASGCTVVFLWWFCLACFDRQFRPRGGVLAVGLCWIALAGAARIIPDPVPALSYTLVGLGFGIVAHLIWRLYAEREGDLIQERYDARAIVAVLLGGLLLIDLMVDLFFGLAWRPLPFAMAQNAAILGFSLWLAGQVLGVRPGVISFEGIAPASATALPVDTGSTQCMADNELRQRLMRLIETDRIHLDPELSFTTFVQRMHAPERAVRRLVNQELGFDHFRSFLNHYRLMEARNILADSCRSTDKLIGVALDSGFASLATFNRVFRTAEECTPGEFRRAVLRKQPSTSDGQASPESAVLKGFETRSAAL